MNQQDKFAETMFWGKVAKQRVYAAFDNKEYEALISEVWEANMSGLTVADIGSASGVSAALFAARGAKVLGIEIAPELVAQAEELWRDYSERIDFRVGDAEHLDLLDASLDAVFFGGLLHHIPLLDQVYAEAFRVLKPGGKLIVIKPNRLDFLELIEWGVADLRGKLTLNEYLIDPLTMRRELIATGFQSPRCWTIRHDIPVLAQISLIKYLFNRHRGTFFIMVRER